jgi:hypothetical protein
VAQEVRAKVDILKWHYILHEHLEADEDEDRMKRNCRYCESTLSLRDCKCAERLGMWWEAAPLVVLVQPSSAAVERVFIAEAFLERPTDSFSFRYYQGFTFSSVQQKGIVACTPSGVVVANHTGTGVVQ